MPPRPPNLQGSTSTGGARQRTSPLLPLYHLHFQLTIHLHLGDLVWATDFELPRPIPRTYSETGPSGSQWTGPRNVPATGSSSEEESKQSPIKEDTSGRKSDKHADIVKRSSTFIFELWRTLQSLWTYQDFNAILKRRQKETNRVG